MTTISLVATDQFLTAASRPKLASGDQNSAVIHVDVDSAWDGYTISGVFFTEKDPTEYDMLLVGGKCTIPWEVLAEPGILYIGIRGVSAKDVAVKTSTFVRYKIVRGASFPNGADGTPTESIYMQFVELVESLKEAYYTPEMYGAVGNGVADDTGPIRNAVLACASNGDRGTVLFSNKTYRITSTIYIPKKMNIEGRSCTIVVDSKDVIDAALHFTNQSDMLRTVIRDVFVRCRKKAINGFRIGDGNAEATQITIDNCKVTHALEDGFKVVPMAYCIRFQDCYAESNGYSGISAVSTDYSHQMNAVSIEGCTLIVNGRHGAHINGINIVVENCIIEVNGIWQNGDGYYCVDADNPGSGIFVGYLPNPSCSSVNIVVQNNYFEPSYEAQITTCVDSVTLRVLNNYFLVGGSRRPEGHHVTNVKCIQPVVTNDKGEEESVESYVSLIYKNNAPANLTQDRIFTDVDGGNLLTAHSDIYAQYVENNSSAKVYYNYVAGNKQYYPLSMVGEDPYQSENLVTSEQKKFIIPVTNLGFGATLVSLGVSASGVIEEGEGVGAFEAYIIFGIKVEHDGISQVAEFTHFVGEGDSEVTRNLNGLFQEPDNTNKYTLPRNARVTMTITLRNTRNAKSFVISNPYIAVYNP